MESDELKAELETLLRTLRQADSQATAVAWMKKAYVAMEACLKQMDERPRALAATETLVFVAAPRKIEVVRQIPRGLARRAPAADWFCGKTVVYPERPIPPSLSQPRPFTIADSRKLAAQTEAKRRIQRLGR